MLVVAGCTLLTPRPIQDLADAKAALKAAKEVGADSAVPAIFLEASEAYFKAERNYQLKNFAIAKDYAIRCRVLAEEAEFEALKLGKNRSSLNVDELPPQTSPPESYEVDKPMPSTSPSTTPNPGNF